MPRPRAARSPASPRYSAPRSSGAATVAALEGTTLASAREQDELVFLNRGAASGELTDIVKEFVEAAVAGKAVSAIAYTKSGAAFRREKVSASNSPSECECLHARIEEVQAQLEHFKNQNSAVRREAKDLRIRQTPFTPDSIVTLTDAELTEALVALGFERFLQVMPAAWRSKLELRAGGRAKVRHPSRSSWAALRRPQPRTNSISCRCTRTRLGVSAG